MEVRSIEAIVKALNAAKVKYLIVGGLAVNAHGYERFTNDVDFGHWSRTRKYYPRTSCIA
jgi:hypothetical protein